MPINMFAPPPQLPHPDIHLSELLIIEEGLRTAWSLLRTTSPLGFDLANADEDEITEQFIQIILDQVLEHDLVRGFGKSLFLVHRESKFRNFNGEKLDKMPDLAVSIIGRKDVGFRSNDELFIECKPVGPKHTVGQKYCDDGIIRFVEGGYAWTMRQAMMIGYVSTGYTIIPKLSDALKDPKRITSPKIIETLDFPYACLNAKSKADLWCEAVYITRHKRNFKYIQNEEPAPPITLRHLWLRRD